MIIVIEVEGMHCQHKGCGTLNYVDYTVFSRGIACCQFDDVAPLLVSPQGPSAGLVIALFVQWYPRSLQRPADSI
eukprot:jgi/Botrbrau1/18676/Bobra.0386s0005.1